MKNITIKKGHILFLLLGIAAALALVITLSAREYRIPQPESEAIEELNPDDYNPSKLDELDDLDDEDENVLPSDIETELNSLKKELNTLNSEDFDASGLE